jgi:hypothetical protein
MVVATYRCPVCISMLGDPQARRCGACGKRLRARKLRVLGDETRVTATELPVDRWMIGRLHGAKGMPAVAWEGRFTPGTVQPPAAGTAAAAIAPAIPDAPAPAQAPAPASASASMAPAAPTDLGSPVAPTAAPVAPAGGREQGSVVDAPEAPAPAPELAPAPAPAAEREPEPAPKVVDALALDQYTQPIAPTTESPTWRSKQTVGDGAAWPARREQLDPEVRALVEELYEQARAEMATEAPAPTERADDPASNELTD